VHALQDGRVTKPGGRLLWKWACALLDDSLDDLFARE
jgi:hypothetical protein